MAFWRTFGCLLSFGRQNHWKIPLKDEGVYVFFLFVLFCFFFLIFFSPLIHNHTTSSQLYYKYLQNLQRLMLGMPNLRKQLNWIWEILPEKRCFVTANFLKVFKFTKNESSERFLKDFRSSCSQVFCEIDVHKKFTKLT